MFLLSAFSANAANLSFTGNLSNDDDVQLFTFSVGSPSTVTLRTWTYAGGTNAAGNIIAAGGFDPILALFDSTGNLIAQNDDGGSNVDPDPVTDATYDTFLSSPFSAGSYIVAIMQYANFANGPALVDGFPGSGMTGFIDATEGNPHQLLGVRHPECGHRDSCTTTFIRTCTGYRMVIRLWFARVIRS